MEIIHGDCLREMRTLLKTGRKFHACVTDPPYHLTSIVKRFGGKKAAAAKVGKTGAYARASRGFMGKEWDGGDIAFNPITWRLVWLLLPPGGWLLAFSGTRTYHRMACAIEEAGFEIRDQIQWMYGTGFPKSHKQAGEFEGWGTALKPAQEPICMARKPFKTSLAENLAQHRVGALNIEGCRIGTEEVLKIGSGGIPCRHDEKTPRPKAGQIPRSAQGRWPANILHDGSDEVLAAFPESDGQNGAVSGSEPSSLTKHCFGAYKNRPASEPRGDTGSAARFFYSAKADASDRMGSAHPTVKPIDLMAYLCRLVVPPGGTVFDPFAGSGTTGIGALLEGFIPTLIERDPDYVADIHARLKFMKGEDLPIFTGKF